MDSNEDGAMKEGVERESIHLVEFVFSRGQMSWKVDVVWLSSDVSELPERMRRAMVERKFLTMRYENGHEKVFACETFMCMNCFPIEEDRAYREGIGSGKYPRSLIWTPA